MIKNRVMVENYQIKVSDKDITLGATEILEDLDGRGEHHTLQLGGDFETWEDAEKHARECFENDYPTCQRLMNGDYVICGNVYSVEQTDEDENGDKVYDFLEIKQFVQPYNGLEK